MDINAFPVPKDAEGWGMSLRDYFAAAAATGLLAHPKCNPVGVGYEKSTKAVASEAYQVADAMLAERAKADAK